MVQIRRSSVHACYPGNEIPIWFDHQFEGSSITIKLPQQWRDTKFLGFVVCAVGWVEISWKLFRPVLLALFTKKKKKILFEYYEELRV